MRCSSLLLFVLSLACTSHCWRVTRPSRHAATRATTLRATAQSDLGRSDVERAVGTLASTTLALLAGDEAAAEAMERCKASDSSTSTPTRRAPFGLSAVENGL